MSYTNLCIAYIRARDYHDRMCLSGDRARQRGSLKLLMLAERRRRLCVEKQIVLR